MREEKSVRLPTLRQRVPSHKEVIVSRRKRVTQTIWRRAPSYRLLPRKRRALLAVANMSSESLTPAVQLVPAAMAISTDHMPLAQRWKDEPPMQFHWPSLVHAVPGVNRPAELVPVPAAGAAVEVVVAAPEPAPPAAVVTVARVVGSGVASGVVVAPESEPPVVAVKKTPPGRELEAAGELTGTTVRGRLVSTKVVSDFACAVD